MKRIVCTLAVALVALFTFTIPASAASPQDKCIRKLERFSKELKKNAPEYTEEDWTAAMNYFEQLSNDIKQYTYDEEELRQIGKLKGRCIGIFARRSLSRGASEINSFMQQLGGFLEGFLETTAPKSDDEDYE